MLYALARIPATSAEERAALAAPFAFSAMRLDHFPERAVRAARSVHPSLSHIAGWISTVGAAVALNDFDRDGLANDVCYVDVRGDLVIVAPVPGTGERFTPLVLDPAPLRYDSATMAPMGSICSDFDEDGWMDILVYYWGRTPLVFLNIEGHGAERSFRPRELTPGMERWYTNSGTTADIDGDGLLDLVLCNYFPDGARILDTNADGIESMNDSMTRAANGGRNRFFLRRPSESDDGRLFDEARSNLPDELLCRWTLAVGAADLDGDLLPEIYVANDFGPDQLLWNRSRPGSLSFTPVAGVRGFTTPRSKVLGSDSFKGMGIDFGDLNADGVQDLHVCNIATEYGLQESHLLFVSTGAIERFASGEAPYEERSEAYGLSRDGWGWDARFGDFDNDGTLEVLHATGFLAGSVNRWPELHEIAMGNDQLVADAKSWHRFGTDDDVSGHQRNPFYVRGADGRYRDVGIEVGLSGRAVSRGIATADVDGDGDLDLAVANQWQPSVFYRNDAPNPGQFLGLCLRLPVHPDERTGVHAGRPGAGYRGRPAVGASARVHLPDGRVLGAEVDGGSGHSGDRAPELHFGLGPTPVHTVTVDLAWRDANGRALRATRAFEPGWHTVLLGAELTRTGDDE
jgi:hypothetical protein